MIDALKSYWPLKPLRLPTFAPESKAFTTGRIPSTNYVRPKSVAYREPTGVSTTNRESCLEKNVF